METWSGFGENDGCDIKYTGALGEVTGNDDHSLTHGD